jgi:glycosyltransferase involved in cell wall biosynthesis
MSFGIPVIAPPAGGPIELLSGGLEDFLIRGDDAVHLASVLSNLQVDKELYKRVSELCRQRAAVFDWQLFVDSLNTEE